MDKTKVTNMNFAKSAVNPAHAAAKAAQDAIAAGHDEFGAREAAQAAADAAGRGLSAAEAARAGAAAASSARSKTTSFIRQTAECAKCASHDSARPNCCSPGGSWEGLCNEGGLHSWHGGFQACRPEKAVQKTTPKAV